MSKLFSKLKKLKVEKVSNVSTDAGTVLYQADVKQKADINSKSEPKSVLVEKTASSRLIPVVLIMTCLLFLGISFKALHILSSVESSNTSVLSRFESSFEQNERQIDVLKARIDTINKENKLKMDSSESAWNDKFKRMQEAMDLQFNQMKLDLSEARTTIETLKIRNRQLEAKIIKLNAGIEQAIPAAAQ